jgi:hypothetical protein
VDLEELLEVEQVEEDFLRITSAGDAGGVPQPQPAHTALLQKIDHARRAHNLDLLRSRR